MFLRFFPCLLSALVLGGLDRDGASLSCALFVLTAALPYVALGAWIDERGRSRRKYVCTIACSALLLGFAAWCWRGFSSGNPPATHLGSLAILCAALTAGPIGLLEFCAAWGLRRSAVSAVILLAWTLLIASPFFLPSWLGAQLGIMRESELAARIVSVHPFGAACDAAGGLDGFRDPILYARAEIGARHAYRYPDSTAYALALSGFALLGALAHFVRTRLSERSRSLS